MMWGKLVLTLASVVLVLRQASGHGRLMDPVGRASAWRLGFTTPVNYDDNALFCGGYARQQSNGGKCGVCGDPWNGVKENEAGGKFATGKIVKTYKQGQIITAKADVTANHNGYFEYRICPNNNPKKTVTHECLNKHVLQLADGSGTRFMVTPGVTGLFSTDLKLPDDMVCTQCVLQWKYHAGNSWGVDLDTGKACVGCGPQEEFYGCADVAIVADDSAPGPKVATNPPTTTAPETKLPIVFPFPIATNPPVPKQPVTNPPTTKSPTTQQPIVIGGNLAGNGLTCHGINNWANSPDLDKWCTDVCNQGNCPPLACDCSPTGAVTPKPTTMAPTTTTTSTTTTTPTTTTPTTTTKPTTTPTTTTTTTSTTTTTPKPTTTTTTAKPTTGSQQIHSHVVCKAINLWAGNEYLDRWCSDACARGNCPPASCKCSLVNVPVVTKTGTVPLASQQKKQCTAIGVWKGIDVFDKWCTGVCNNGNCPPKACTCIDVRASGSQSAGVAVQGYGHCPSLAKDSQWDSWCQNMCDNGKCAHDFCTCNQ